MDRVLAAKVLLGVHMSSLWLAVRCGLSLGLFCSFLGVWEVPGACTPLNALESAKAGAALAKLEVR